ncbi:MAG: DUF362 domain-containing protein [Candidatus Brocadia sinica]|nr:DUF362 domain-containing protein [Candidatus Brocadia sinica]NUO03891.1 DUF362 domain-containing protein [Candidatus Brocadia sinica]
MRITRYPLFYVIGISIYLILNLRWRYVFKHLFLRPKTKKVHLQQIPNVYKDNDKILVSLVQGEDIYAMLKEGIELLGGLEKLDIQGKSVLIKPNIVNRYPNPANTNPLVIKHLIKLLHKSGVSKILVGDMSAIFTLPTKKNAMKSGIWEAIQTDGATFVPFEDHGWVEVDIPHGRFMKKAMVSEIIYSVDRIINVPVIKTHNYANYSISLKNFIGAIHPQQRPYFIAPDFWDEVVAEMNIAYTPHLNILDGTKIFVKGGPTKGTVATPNLIIATGDRIAADVVGLSIIRAFGGRERTSSNKDVWEQRQVKRAIDLHLGVSDPSELKIISKSLSTNKPNFDKLIEEIQHYLNK